MRDVNIGRVKGNVSISDHSSSGGGFETLLYVAAALFVGVVVINAALAIVHIVVEVLLISFFCLLGLTVLGAGFRFRHGIARLLGVQLPERQPRGLRPQHEQLGIPPYKPPITGKRGKVLVELDRADAERLRQLMNGWGK